MEHETLLAENVPIKFAFIQNVYKYNPTLKIQDAVLTLYKSKHYIQQIMHN